MRELVQNSDIDKYVIERDLRNELLMLRLRNESRIGMFHLGKGWISAPLWMPITDDRHMFLGFNQIYAGAKYEPLLTPDFADQLDHADEEEIEHIFVLGGEANYWHFLMDFLPRLVLFKAMPALASYRMLISQNLSPGQIGQIEDISKRFNIAPTLIKAGEGVHRLRDAWISSRIERKAALAVWNEYLLPESERPRGGPERLFVMRNDVDKRRLINQDEIVEVLKPFGFTCIDPGTLPFHDQVSLFSEAKVVVGVHGAALTNLLFSPPGGRLLELYTGQSQPFFRDLATLKGLTHTSIQGASNNPELNQHADFSIPKEDVVAAVKQLLM